ncbi:MULTISPECIES: tRNA (guanosine(46)-N7)-methyltransferase TrmB [unclassified Siphonobacter]|uniref:tRNA (guanosine(46)-N7)-methyltransferase TrmB n=1 Tax=unclassified Siphonobacter TaxID=2635712 RepID=UPI000CBA61A7|nr:MULTISPECIES: tRNA (guanosine(46)-N7)-methyltransferase TrmB [unclassified Siphonobacter]PKK36417.1 tRNA (guanosine(46)-N7)-methyltransferase TrmB [Siphonobacter sp. SORGH_AS_0500]
MARQKLQFFAHNIQADNVLEAPKPIFQEIKGQWNERYFKNNNPIVVEIGCGKGEYSNGLGKLFPEKNFVGVDMRGDRLARGSKVAINAGLTNVAFLRTRVQDIYQFFAEDEVDEIWVTFPDPRPRNRDIKRRLTHPRFLNMYASMLKKDGLFHLKTDSDSLFEYTLETLEPFGCENLTHTWDLYESDLNMRHFGIKTKYEALFYDQGFSIKYLSCNLTPKVIVSPLQMAMDAADEEVTSDLENNV